MPDKPPLTPPRRNERDARAERLARALRDNLHRRKEQSRAREAPAADPPSDNEAGGKSPA